MGGRPVAYFDGPGGTQVPLDVVDAMRDYLLRHNANTGWNYPTSRETDQIVAHARTAFADFFGGRPDEIAFGPNMTTLTLRISRALGRRLRPGDPIVITELDHHANVDPWKALTRERDAEIRIARMDPDSGTLDTDDLVAKLDGARILAIGAASNALGTVTDLGPITALASAAGATVFVDAVHLAPHRLLDVRALGADFVVISPYKFYGPHLGVLWGRREVLEALEFPRVASAPDHPPDRVETGTQPFENIAGAAAAISFLGSLASSHAAGLAEAPAWDRTRIRNAFAEIDAIVDPLFQRLYEGLDALPNIHIYGPGPAADRTPTLAFAIGGADSESAAGRLAEEGVFASHGDFYATTAVDRLGARKSGLLRVGLMAYNTDSDVDRLLQAVQRLP